MLHVIAKYLEHRHTQWRERSHIPPPWERVSSV